MKKKFSIQFFRPPHMPLNDKVVDKYNSLPPPAKTLTNTRPNGMYHPHLS
jgi:hypothetical protein